ncbi:hypothetical protein ACIBG8_42410 [Nonomuraea sp. NPDC050556]|uniref:hypothetical protein n=1 Tax=Nonomuraea sp. NPDC050556 TaxID=3364369 RepID=UPI0037A478BF
MRREFQIIDEVMPDVPEPADVAQVRARVLGSRQRRPHPRLLVAMAAAVVAALLVVVPRLGEGQHITATTDGAVQALETAAQARAARPMEDDRGWWTREMVQIYWGKSDKGDFMVMEQFTDTLWVDPTGRNMEEYGASTVKPADEAAWRLAGSPKLCPAQGCGQKGVRQPVRDTFQLAKGLDLTLAQVKGLPTEVEALRAALLAYYAPYLEIDQDTWLWGAGERLLLDAPTSGGTRAALYRLLAALPGTALVEGVEALPGFTDTIALVRGAPVQEQIVIHRRSGDLAAVQDVALDAAVAAERMVGVGAPFQRFFLYGMGMPSDPPPSFEP